MSTVDGITIEPDTVAVRLMQTVLPVVRGEIPQLVIEIDLWNYASNAEDDDYLRQVEWYAKTWGLGAVLQMSEINRTKTITIWNKRCQPN